MSKFEHKTDDITLEKVIKINFTSDIRRLNNYITFRKCLNTFQRA